MKSDDVEPEQDQPTDNLHRNQLLVAVVASCLVTLVLAAYLGAYSSADFENLTDWLAVIIAACAAGISLYAVVQVSKTLLATQQTLKLTQEMAADTKRIGDAQIRPWVLVDRYDVRGVARGSIIDVWFKNYGVSPASYLTLTIAIDCYGDDYNVEGDELFLGVWNEDTAMDDFLVPNRERKFSVLFVDRDFPDDADYLYLRVTWTYHDISSKQTYEDEILRGITYVDSQIFLDDIEDSLGPMMTKS